MDSDPALWAVCIVTGAVGGALVFFFEKVGRAAVGGLFATLMAYTAYLVVLHLIPDHTNAVLYSIIGVACLVGMGLGIKAHQTFLLVMTSITGSFGFVSGIDLLTRHQLNYTHIKHGDLDSVGWGLIVIWVLLSVAAVFVQRYCKLKKCLGRQKAQELVSPLLPTQSPVIGDPIVSQISVSAIKTTPSVVTRMTNPCGLANLGNTCFFNAAVQALNAVTPIRQNFSQRQPNQGKVTTLLSALLRQMNAAATPSIQPSEIKHLLSHLHFNDYRQHDSFEFARSLLNAVIEEVPKDEKNVAKQIFTFDTVGVVRCDECGNQSAMKEECLDLSLEMPEESATVIPLESLMTNYFKPTSFSGSNSYHCEKCNKLTSAKRTLHIGSFPQSLIVSLNRFRYSATSDVKVKLMTQVSIPGTLLVTGIPYNLEAVVVHSGSSTEAGHYYSFAKLPTRGSVSSEWFRCDDRSVVSVDYETVTNTLCRNMSRDSAYYLFYSK